MALGRGAYLLCTPRLPEFLLNCTVLYVDELAISKVWEHQDWADFAVDYALLDAVPLQNGRVNAPLFEEVQPSV